jgi:hypothetical protein
MQLTTCNIRSTWLGCRHPGMELLVPVQSANNNTSGSQPLANNYMQNNVDILTNNVHADSNESNVLNTL